LDFEVVAEQQALLLLSSPDSQRYYICLFCL